MEIDSLCTPAKTTISTVVAGSAQNGGACLPWDGLYYSIPFTPNKVTASVACTDSAPTWIYEVDTASIDRSILKVQIDSLSNLIWVKPMTTGSGTVLQTTLTVNGRLPTGNTASFTFTLLVSFCGKEPFLPPTRVDQIYYVTDPQTSYELPVFTVNAACPQPTVYTNSISTNTWISGFFGNNGLGRKVSWYSTDPFTHVG